MNIFRLHDDPEISAIWHVDKHVVKMIIEYAQLLSTAHRVIDGYEGTKLSKSGKRKVKTWILDDLSDEATLYKSCHVNHPSGVWTRETVGNYNWLYSLFKETCKEYTYRYGRIHMTAEKLLDRLADAPRNINQGNETPLLLAMNNEPQCKHHNPVIAYRQYYQTKQKRMPMVWTKREKPFWFAT